MAGVALDAFESQAEAFLRAKAWSELQYETGDRPGRGLNSLYDEDFPDFTSRDLLDDLQDAAIEDGRHKRSLVALLANAYFEGRTRHYAAPVAGLVARTTVQFENEDIPWREVPARWPLLGDVPRRHALAEAWRSALHADINPPLERWFEALRGELTQLGATDWLGFWAEQHGYDVAQLGRLAQTLLDISRPVYEHALGVYLAQVGLPVDDAWVADVDWAFRAPRFDAVFSERERMPVLIRAFRDLGIELEEQANLLRDVRVAPGVRYVALDVPSEVHVVQRLGGGYQDYVNSLLGFGMAEHLAHTDGKLTMWERWLCDETPTLAYGRLLEGLVRDRTWLVSRLGYESNDDFRVIATLAWLMRIRGAAARHLYEQQLWQSEPGSGLAADFEVSMASALRVRHFGDEYLLGLLNAPWSTLSAATDLRAELFAAHVRAYLRREFDDEWWHSPRAARFIVDELWRTGRRHSAEELLGFMGYVEGFDPGILWSDVAEVLAPL